MPGGIGAQGCSKRAHLSNVRLLKVPSMPFDDFLMKADRTPSGLGAQPECVLRRPLPNHQIHAIRSGCRKSPYVERRLSRES